MDKIVMATIFLVIFIGIVDWCLIDKLYEMIKSLERKLEYEKARFKDFEIDIDDSIDTVAENLRLTQRAISYDIPEFDKKCNLAAKVNGDLKRSNFNYGTIIEMERIQLNKIKNNSVKCCPSCKYWKACAEQDSNVYGRCLANNWDFYIGCKDPHSMWCNSYENLDDEVEEDEA